MELNILTLLYLCILFLVLVLFFVYFSVANKHKTLNLYSIRNKIVGFKLIQILPINYVLLLTYSLIFILFGLASLKLNSLTTLLLLVNIVFLTFAATVDMHLYKLPNKLISNLAILNIIVNILFFIVNLETTLAYGTFQSFFGLICAIVLGYMMVLNTQDFEINNSDTLFMAIIAMIVGINLFFFIFLLSIFLILAFAITFKKLNRNQNRYLIPFSPFILISFLVILVIY